MWADSNGMVVQDERTAASQINVTRQQFKFSDMWFDEF